MRALRSLKCSMKSCFFVKLAGTIATSIDALFFFSLSPGRVAPGDMLEFIGSAEFFETH